MDWKVGGAVAGQVKSGGGLSFITVNNAGHQVPMDQPANVRNSVKSSHVASICLLFNLWLRGWQLFEFAALQSLAIIVSVSKWVVKNKHNIILSIIMNNPVQLSDQQYNVLWQPTIILLMCVGPYPILMPDFITAVLCVCRHWISWTICYMTSHLCDWFSLVMAITEHMHTCNNTL